MKFLTKSSCFLLTAVRLVMLLALISACRSQAKSPTPSQAISPSPSPVISSTPPLAASPVLTASPPSATRDLPGISDHVSNTFPYVEIDTIDYGELSGIVFHPQRETLFAVSDKGHIIETTPEGTLVQTVEARQDADFEGIAYNPETGLLYVAVEGDEVILEVNPGDLAVLRSIPIDRVFDDRVLLDPRGDGVEGIAYVPAGDGAGDGSLYLVNQSKQLGGKDPSILFQVAITGPENQPIAKIIRYFALGVTDLSGLHYDPSDHQLLVISDENDLFMGVSLSGQVLFKYPLPGVNQEGIAVDMDGFLYIAQDSKESLLKLAPNEPSS